MRVVFDTNLFVSAFIIPESLGERAEWVRPTIRISVLKDEPDNKILECAVFGKANMIVTGDKEVLRLKEHGKTKIVSLKAYLEF